MAEEEKPEIPKKELDNLNFSDQKVEIPRTTSSISEILTPSEQENIRHLEAKRIDALRNSYINGSDESVKELPIDRYVKDQYDSTLGGYVPNENDDDDP